MNIIGSLLYCKFPCALSVGSKISDFLTANHPADPDSCPVLDDVAADNNIWLYGANAIIICVIAAIFLWGLSNVLLKSKDYTKYLKPGFIIAWVFAFVVYDVGMYTGQYISLFTNAPMAVIHAFETFLLGSDVSAIHEPFHNSWFFMCLFSFSHALSAVVSMMFLIKVFGFNVIQKWGLFKESRRGDWPWKLLFLRGAKKKQETFVLWGINSVTYKMADSIKKHMDAIDNSSYRIIVINTGDDSDDNSENATGFNKVFDIISLKDSELRQFQELGCLIAKAKPIDTEGAVDTECDILRAKFSLKSVARILGEKTSEKIHILFLSDDEKQNLRDVSVLLNDSTLNEFARKNGIGSVRFYCHARHNGVHRVIEDLHCSAGMEVRIVDSSHINVELLKNNATVLPVSFVDVEADAAVSSPFNAMIVGFSEVGQDAARFLYEFGSFVKSGGNNDEAVRCDFHLDIIDNHMEEKAGVFLANTPAIQPSFEYLPDLKNPDALISLHHLDCRSERFFKMLESKIKSLNYIVLATENDELNMTMGVRIFRAAARYRKNLDNFCILIRVHEDSDGHFHKIAEYYNKLWAAQDENNIGGNDRSVKHKKSDPAPLPMYIFGLDKDVYTYDNVIDDSIIKRAAEFKEEYEKATNADYHEPTSEKESAWAKEIKKLLQIDAEYHPPYAALMRLRRTQGQDIANSLHCLTKELLAQKALAKLEISESPWSTLCRVESRTVYATAAGAAADSRINRLLTVLAQTEHLRWNASHEILGYVYDANGKNEIRLLHNCLTDWSNLTEHVRSYDYTVVDVTLGISIKQEKPTAINNLAK